MTGNTEQVQGLENPLRYVQRQVDEVLSDNKGKDLKYDIGNFLACAADGKSLSIAELEGLVEANLEGLRPCVRVIEYLIKNKDYGNLNDLKGYCLRLMELD